MKENAQMPSEWTRAWGTALKAAEMNKYNSIDLF